jgi:pimeloyl-ACP methyl ester carboxylesterase
MNAPFRKGYSDGPFGQVHWQMTDATEGATAPDLYCLHPAPFTGFAYNAIMPHLSKNRRVFAPDFPGHGGSGPHHNKPLVSEYAAAMAAVIDDQSGGGPVDLLGFHTGCLVAVELSLAYPQKAGKLMLIDVPAFDPDTRTKFLANASAPMVLTPDLESLRPAWVRGIDKRIESQSLERSFEMFVEQLRHGADMNTAFHAGFSYDVEGRFAKVSCPTSIIATQSMLLDATRRAASLIAGAQLKERLDVSRAVLDESAETIAADILAMLDD